MSCLYRRSDKKAGTFYLSWYCAPSCVGHPDGGEHHCVSLRTKDRKRAEALQDAKDRDLEQQKARATLGLTDTPAYSSAMTLVDFRDFYLDKMERERLVAVETLYRNHRPFLNKLIEFAPAALLSQIDAAWVERYQLTVRRHYADHGWNSRRATLRSIFNRAVDWSLMPRNPFIDLQRAKRPQKTRPKRLYQEQLPIILRHEKSDFWKLVALFLYATGVRLSEMRTLRRIDVRPQQGYLAIVRNKERKEKLIPLTPAILKIVMAAQQFSESEYVFSLDGSLLSRNAVTRHFDRLSERCGFKVSAHRFRHSHGTHVLEGGSNIRAIQETLGHSDIRTTAGFYLDVDLAGMQRSMALLPIDALIDGSNFATPNAKLLES